VDSEGCRSSHCYRWSENTNTAVSWWFPCHLATIYSSRDFCLLCCVPYFAMPATNHG